MIIENLRKEIHKNRIRIVATVIWENNNRPSQDIYFETYREFEEDFHLNPNTFLLAFTIPAMRYGEKRITLSEPICSEVKDGLINAMKCLIEWHKEERHVIDIQAPIQTETPFINNPKCAGAFFSGGIDAIAMLRDNHLNFPPNHHRRIQDGILVYGILQGEAEYDSSFQNVIDAVSTMAQDAEIGLIQLSTNAYASFRDLDADFKFWRLEYMGSFLAAIAHCFAPRFTTVSIASTYDYANLDSWGSHPLLDPLYGNTALQIRHENSALSRLEKTKLVGEWDTALKNLRVCNEKSSYGRGNYNCGKCDKCVKTMTALLALDLLEQTTTFVEKNISKELLINNCYPSDAYSASNYLELIKPLIELGRHDLVEGIEHIIRRYRERDFKGLIKRLDRFFLGGKLLEKRKEYSNIN